MRTARRRGIFGLPHRIEAAGRQWRRALRAEELEEYMSDASRGLSNREAAAIASKYQISSLICSQVTISSPANLHQT